MGLDGSPVFKRQKNKLKKHLFIHEVTVKSFELEPKLTIEEDPLEWLKYRKQKYPLIFQLSRKYFSVMGTSTPAERVFSKIES